jgi:hypothetical protein
MLMQSNREDPCKTESPPSNTYIWWPQALGNTAKLRHRGMKVAPTANCLLCRQLDEGRNYSMSGCPHMSGMYTERHNIGGHALLKALLKGGRGLDVVMHAIGHAADAALMQHPPQHPVGCSPPESQNGYAQREGDESPVWRRKVNGTSTDQSYS